MGKELGIKRGSGGGKCCRGRCEIKRYKRIERFLREQLRREGKIHVPTVLEKNREEMEMVLRVTSENGKNQFR